MPMGFKLPDNFRRPYGAIGFRDFWRRWHISLSAWLRDYLYISLGGNRRGRLRTSYAYVLAPQAGGTRLTARLRMGGRPALGAMLAAPLVLAGHEAGQRIQFLRLRPRISAR